MIRPIDLHTHSNKSDGTLTPSALVELALQKGLAALALTDHDTTDGIDEAAAAAAGTSLQFIPGVELSASYNGRDIHIVGLYLDYNHPDFKSRIRTFADERDVRNQKMCERLAADGYAISYEELPAQFPHTIINRAHIAQVLTEKGYCASISEAFKKLIGDDCKYFVSREKISPREAIAFIRKFHGVPILAHPLQYKLTDGQLESLVRLLCEQGLVGIEAYYNSHTPSDTGKIAALADRYGLILSGGSDFHGSRKKGLQLGTGYGKLFIPDTLLDPIKEKAGLL